MLKVLNLYAGIGGNRKLWEDVEVTAVEKRKDIADVYRYYFPNDIIVVGDAHQYLLDHYQEFDFIWTSTPCPTHSRANFWGHKNSDKVLKQYPDMRLYQEILFLKHYFDGKYVCENVDPFYEPLIPETRKLGRHLFWSNFYIGEEKLKEADIKNGNREEWSELHGFDLSKFKIDSRKDQIYRNCVHPETGLYLLECARGIINRKNKIQTSLFNEL